MMHPWLSQQAQEHRYAQACLDESTAPSPSSTTACLEHLHRFNRKASSSCTLKGDASKTTNYGNYDLIPCHRTIGLQRTAGTIDRDSARKSLENGMTRKMCQLWEGAVGTEVPVDSRQRSVRPFSCLRNIR